MSSSVLLRSESLQKQIVRILADRIHKGDYLPGAMFPSENQLASEFNVSRATVRSAMTALEAKGLIFRRQGIGSFVRETSISNPIGEFVDFLTLIESSGFTPGVQVLNAYTVDASCELAQDLELEEDTSVIRTESVFTADGNPVIFTVNAIPGWVLGATLTSHLIQSPEIAEPLIGFMNERCHQKINSHQASLWADLVENFEMDIPDYPPKTTILVINSIAYNEDKRPIFQSLTAYPDKRMKFKIDRH
jgi:GntR family transcriptional regulator